MLFSFHWNWVGYYLPVHILENAFYMLTDLMFLFNLRVITIACQYEKYYRFQLSASKEARKTDN